MLIYMLDKDYYFRKFINKTLNITQKLMLDLRQFYSSHK